MCSAKLALERAIPLESVLFKHKNALRDILPGLEVGVLYNLPVRLCENRAAQLWLVSIRVRTGKRHHPAPTLRVQLLKQHPHPGPRNAAPTEPAGHVVGEPHRDAGWRWQRQPRCRPAGHTGGAQGQRSAVCACTPVLMGMGAHPVPQLSHRQVTTQRH